MRRKQKTEKQLLDERAINLWKIACIKMWGNRSIVSNQKADVCHHYILRSKSKLLKYDPKNGVPLTNGEHFILHKSGDPVAIARIIKTIRRKRGKVWCRYIDRKEKMSQAGVKYSYYTADFIRGEIKKLIKYINS